MSGADLDLVAACRDIRLLATVYWGLWIGTLIVAVSFGAMYHYGVRFRLPRMRKTIQRLATERDHARAKAIRSELEREDEKTQASLQMGLMRTKMETIGVEAQKEINRLDGIRRKTESRLIEQNRELEVVRAELTEEKDLRTSLEAFLVAVKDQQADNASWFDPTTIPTELPTVLPAATK